MRKTKVICTKKNVEKSRTIFVAKNTTNVYNVKY